MNTIQSSREIQANTEEVFAAFSNPQRLAHWWGPEGFTNTFKIAQDARLYFGRLAQKEDASYILEPERGAWIHVIKGTIKVNGYELSQADGAAIENESKVALQGQ